jgi:hypothetical protein
MVLVSPGWQLWRLSELVRSNIFVAGSLEPETRGTGVLFLSAHRGLLMAI